MTTSDPRSATEPSRGPYVTGPQAAARLRAAGFDVTAMQIRNWARTGRIASTRLPNGRLYIPLAQVQALISGDHATVEEGQPPAAGVTSHARSNL